MERARDEKGRFLADDSSTPMNEAYKMSEEQKSTEEVATEVAEANAAIGEAKSALKSKGMWGSALAIIATAVLVWCDANSIELSALTQTLLQGFAMCSGGLAMYGRAKASGPVAIFPKK